MNRAIPKSYQLTTLRFCLRIPDSEDIPQVFSATRYKGFNDGMQWEPPVRQEEFLASLDNSIKSWEEGTSYNFTIVEKDDTKLLGRISIRQTAVLKNWNVGFWTHPELQGQGIMTEALEAVLKFGFEKLAAERIEAYYAIWNKASQKVLERNGMSFIKYEPKGFLKKGKWVEENLMVITKVNW